MADERMGAINEALERTEQSEALVEVTTIRQFLETCMNSCAQSKLNMQGVRYDTKCKPQTR